MGNLPTKHPREGTKSWANLALGKLHTPVNTHDQPFDFKLLPGNVHRGQPHPRAARIRSRISFAAAGMLVPGPKIAFTPAPFRKS